MRVCYHLPSRPCLCRTIHQVLRLLHSNFTFSTLMLISLRWLRFQDKMIQNASYLCRFFSFSVAGNSPKESVLGIAIRLLWQNVSKKRVSVQSTHCRKCAVGCIIEEISWATMLRDLIAFIGNHLNNGTKKKGGAFTV